MVLWFVGAGLGEPSDITVRGLEAIKAADAVFLESYTSIFPGFDKEALEEYFGKPVVDADREFVEGDQGSEEMISRAEKETIVFLVVGDSLCATTHTDLYLRAKKSNIEVKVVHNASIMNAVAVCGLQLYRFGETISIPYWTAGWRPDSFWEKVVKNRQSNLHTLCLLDIKTKEQSEENLMRGRKIYEPPRFMSCAEALEQLLEIDAKGKATHLENVVGVARVGRDDMAVVSGSAAFVMAQDLGGPLHSLVICAPELHDLEGDMLASFVRE